MQEKNCKEPMTLKDKGSTYFHIRKNKIKIKSWIIDKELRKILIDSYWVHSTYRSTLQE